MKPSSSSEAYHSCLCKSLLPTRPQLAQAVDDQRARHEMDELSRELEVLKNSHLQLRLAAWTEAPSLEGTLSGPAVTSELGIGGTDHDISGEKEEEQQKKTARFASVIQPHEPTKANNKLQQLEDEEPRRRVRARGDKENRGVDSRAEAPAQPKSAAANDCSKKMMLVPARTVQKPPLKPSPIAKSAVSVETRKDAYLFRLLREHAPQKVQTPDNPSQQPESGERRPGVLLVVGEDTRGTLSEKFAYAHSDILESMRQREEPYKKAARRPPVSRTREDILCQRKLMMRSTVEHHREQTAFVMVPGGDSGVFGKSFIAPQSGLLERLTSGERAKVGRKEMIKLTRKNYEMLPEVVKKRKEEIRRAELAGRIKHAKEFEKVSSRVSRL